MPGIRTSVASAALVCAIGVAGLAPSSATGQGADALDLTALRQRATQDLMDRSSRWAPLRRRQEEIQGALDKLSLVPDHIYERAFRMLDDPAFSLRVVEAFGGEAADAAETARAAARGGEGAPDFGGLTSGGSRPPEREPTPGSLPEEFTVLLQDPFPDRWPAVRSSLLLRVRGQLKQDAMRAQVSYGGVPLMGLHPYQVFLLTEGSDEEALAVHMAFARLGALFAAPPVFRPAEGLAQVFEQRSRMDMVAGYALYRVLRAEEGLDARIHEAALEVLARSLRSMQGAPGARPSSNALLLASLLDMIDKASRRGSVEDAVTILYAVYVDYKLGVLGLQGRVRQGGAEDAAPGLEGDPAARVRTMLTLDDLLGGLTLLPPLPPSASRRPEGPFRPLEASEHLRRLRAFHDQRLVRARELRDRILEKIEEFQRAAPGRRPRLHADISRLAVGEDPRRPSSESLMGLVGSQEFEAERRYLLWLGIPRSPGGHDAFYRLFGDPYATPPTPGEVASIRADLEGRILPFLRDWQVSRGEVDPRDPGALVDRYGELDQLAGRLRTLDQQLANPNLDAATRARLLAERQNLLGRFQERAGTLRSPDPLSRMDKYRLVRSMLASGRHPDGTPLSAQEREVLERERVRLEREMYPTRGEARTREQQLDDALRRGVDLDGRPADPRTLDAIREERDRMRTVSRGADPGAPVGARPDDRVPDARPPEGAGGVPPVASSTPSGPTAPSSSGAPGGADPAGVASSGRGEPGGPGAPGTSSGVPGAEPPPPGVGDEVPPPEVGGERTTETVSPPVDATSVTSGRPGEGADRTSSRTSAGDLDPAILDAQVLAARTRWIAQNGANPWGFPPYATQAEIQALLDAAIARRQGPGSQPGLTVGTDGLETGVVAGQGVITSNHGGHDMGKYRFWLEVRDPAIAGEVQAELERRHQQRMEEIRVEVQAAGMDARDRGSDGPVATAEGR